jgi:hypothetical protein
VPVSRTKADIVRRRQRGKDRQDPKEDGGGQKFDIYYSQNGKKKEQRGNTERVIRKSRK